MRCTAELCEEDTIAALCADIATREQELTDAIQARADDDAVVERLHSAHLREP